MENDGPSEKDEQLDQLVKAVLDTSKYRNVCEDLIKNIGMRELRKRQNLKKAIKSTKNKLHQIAGAYFLHKPSYELWLEKLRNARKSPKENLFRRTCAEIMSYHYSTRERLDILDQFYAKIFSVLPSIGSIMDVACGFHPLSIPWMPLSENVRYYSYDIYRDLIDFLNEFMTIIGVQGYAEIRDVVQYPPEINTDLAFILDSIPCLEQIERSAGVKLLESINANSLVVSFPVRSLGGKEKQMRKHYEARFDYLTQKKDWVIQRLDFDTELVFLITKEL